MVEPGKQESPRMDQPLPHTAALGQPESAGPIHLSRSVMTDNEFRRGWRLVLVAALGSGLGVAGLSSYNAGLFVASLHTAIGLTRAQYGLATLGATAGLAIAAPFTGRVIDRMGVRGPAIFGSCMFVTSFLLLAFANHSVAAYIGIMFGTAMLASPASPVGYSRVVVSAFVRHRGLALGLTQLGLGLSAMLVPPLIGVVIAAHGWQAGYVVLACLAAAGMLPALLGLRGVSAAAGARAVDDGSFARVRRSRIFWVQWAAFAVMALGFMGVFAHFVPMLRDAGLPPQLGGWYAGLMGVAVVISRLGIGWLADHIDASKLAAGICGVAALGCLAFAFGGLAWAPVTALALGAALGTEADLVGFMTARYFGLNVYARAYSWQYAAFILATGVSSAWIGALADRVGGYRPGLFIVCVLLMGAAGLFLCLPRTGAAQEA
jgi:MFS family permease